MRSRFVGRVSDVVRGLFRESKRGVETVRPSARLCLETLEQRLALSVNPLPQGINLSVPGDAYVLAGTAEATDSTPMTKWSQPGGLGTPVTITYSYSNVLGGQLGLSASVVKAAIQEALTVWASAAPLRFVEVPDSGPAISTTDYTKGSTPMIRFGSLAIDGAGATLGYGYYPGAAGLSGDIVFDTGEHWTTDAATGVDLIEVAEHEIGHALGLAHEPSPADGGLQATMNPYYAGLFDSLGTSHLFLDDINGIRALYGAGVGSLTPYNPTPIGPASVTPGFTLTGTTLYITGTSGADSVIFSGAGAGSVSLNGISYGGSLAAVQSIVIDTGAGQDSVSVTGSTAAEAFALKPGGLTMTGAKWNVTVANAESITVTGGAEDTASFVDGPGVNSFIASPTQATLTGAGYSLVAKGVGSVTARVVAGGTDGAWLYGSTGNNSFVSTPSMAWLHGAGYSITVLNFRTVYAYSSGQGDTATLSGAAGSYTLYANPSWAWLEAADGTSNVIAVGFAAAVVNPGTGGNRAILTGSTGNDSGVTTPTQVTLGGTGYSIAVNGFGVVAVAGGGGIDSVVLNASSVNDIFAAASTIATLRRGDGGYVYQFGNFANVTVNASASGYDSAYLNATPGVNALVVSAGATTLSGGGSTIRVLGFENVAVTSVGGQDQVSIYDSTGAATFAASGSIATVTYAASRVQLAGFASASVFNTSTVTDKKKVGATPMSLEFWGSWQ